MGVIKCCSFKQFYLNDTWKHLVTVTVMCWMPLSSSVSVCLRQCVAVLHRSRCHLASPCLRLLLSISLYVYVYNYDYDHIYVCLHLFISLTVPASVVFDVYMSYIFLYLFLCDFISQCDGRTRWCWCNWSVFSCDQDVRETSISALLYHEEAKRCRKF